MSAGWRGVEIRLDGSVLHVRCEVVNQNGESWGAEAGWAAGYHLFDEPSGTLVVDGDRTPLDVEPGSAQPLSIEIALPPEPGEYNIYVSVMREHVAWFYEQGWPFLLIDVTVDESGAPKLMG